MLVYSKGKYFEIDLTKLVIESDTETVNVSVHYDGDNGKPRGILAIRKGKELKDFIKNLMLSDNVTVTDRLIPESRIITLEMQASYIPVNGKLPKTPSVTVKATKKDDASDLSDVLSMNDLKSVLGVSVATSVMDAINKAKKKTTANKKPTSKR